MAPARADAVAACRAALDAAIAAGSTPDLTGVDEAVLDAALRALVKDVGAGAAAGLLERLSGDGQPRSVRKAARRALYRLDPAAAGAAAPRGGGTAPAPVVRREAERVPRAYVSSIDGTGSRGVWLIVEGGLGGGMRLCSLLLNDALGVVDASGGSITRRRLDIELARIAGDAALPWIEVAPARALALVGEALALHAERGTPAPARFEEWRAAIERLLATSEVLAATWSPPAPAPLDLALAERTPALLAEPDMASWFADPDLLQSRAVALLDLRNSQGDREGELEDEREAAIVDGAVADAFDVEACTRLARRLDEMAAVFTATARPGAAELADAAATALRDTARETRWSNALLRAMTERGLALACDVALGRATLDDVSRAPMRPAGS